MLLLIMFNFLTDNIKNYRRNSVSSFGINAQLRIQKEKWK